MKSKIAVIIFLIIDLILLFHYLLQNANIQLFNPAGAVALQESHIILFTIALLGTIVVIVVLLTYFIVWRYRDTNTKIKRKQNPNVNEKMQILWWIIPLIVVAILTPILWNGIHQLDPYRPIASSVKPIPIQVVALRWKWLFIYPEQHIATVNFIEFPENTPVSFELTAGDAPMSSFWIPQLGTQVYAMSGMQTQLHLIANKMGEFQGEPTEINGAGFSGMKFIANATSQDQFNAWVQSIQTSAPPLDHTIFLKLSKPTQDNPAAFYYLTDKNLYNEIMMQYMVPSPTSGMMDGMKM